MEIKMQKMMKRVKAGIAYLDAVYGQGWRRKIKIKELDLSSEESCPLGQTDTSYTDHKDAIGLSDLAAYNLGFHIRNDGGKEFGHPDWRLLTSAWKRALKVK